ncbi:MAG: sigma 54-interacting transcriptional regulator [Sandaracinaceae bacterium]
MTGSIVVAGTDDFSGRGITARLRERGYRTEHQAQARGLLERLRVSSPDLAVASLPLPDFEIRPFLQTVKELDAQLKVIVVGPSELFDPGPLMLDGAFDCVPDPLVQPHRLLSAVGYALGARQEDRELEYIRHKDAADVQLTRLVGEDPSMEKTFYFVRQVVMRTARGASPTILLTGETGTGKGAMAKCIHYSSARRNRPFVEVNCAAIPANLVESELFGYEAGAFTDARRARAGLFETADGGTLFLDEIASLPLDLQAKLLVAIEEKRFRRIGGRVSIQVDVQLIAASQPNIKRMVRERTFREDLFHRLNVLSCEIPPLRERGGDRLRLARRFVEEFCAEYGMPTRELSEDAIDFINRYHWPGNVRELRNQIERIVLLGEEEIVESWQFERASGEFIRVEQDERGLRLSLPPRGLDLTQLEREVIKRALELNQGNVSKTARYLSISRQTLIYRMKKFDLG